MTTSAGDEVFIAKTISDTEPPNGNELFFGFTSDTPLSDITLHTVVGDTIAIDSVRTSLVPEPQWSLFLAAGGGMLLAGKRVRTHSVDSSAS
jgi:hypothetical protein